MSQLQWGFVKNGSCGSCSTTQELWVVSARHQNNPFCSSCLIAEIEGEVNSCRWYISNEDNTEEDILAMIIQRDTFQALLDESPENSDIYGIREQKCHMCYGIASEDTPLVESIIKGGDLVMTHSTCAHTCEGCDTRFARNVGISWRLARRLATNYLERHGVDLMYLSPEDSFQCKACIDAYIEDHGGMGQFFMCANCELHDYHQETRWFNDDTYCDTCFNDNVYECDDCSESYWSDSGHDCSYDDDSYGVIHSYDYRPRPIFFGHTEARYYLGFELEVEAFNDDRGRGAEIAQDIMRDHAYMKSDGSLNDGFEIVTHPHTLEAYSEMDWSALERLRSEGFRSWNTDTCGLHVHVSRTAFGNGNGRRLREFHMSRQMHELRFMKLIYDNQRQVERLAGRRSNHYASFMDKGSLVKKVKFGQQNNGRYSVINTANDDTIEVRIFRGSLRKERVMSALEFVTASVEYTRNLKVNSKNGALSWTHFVAYVVSNAETYPNLLAKMNESFDKDALESESYA